MDRGLYVSALGMITQMNKMDVVSNNIANVDTNGFKKDTVVTRSFSEELMSRLDDPADTKHAEKIGKSAPGVFVDDVYTNFATGSFRITNSPLDVSINGDGFFSVNVKDPKGNISEKYTRSGSFTLGPDGTLVTKDGQTVLGENGSIVITGGKINIDENGRVSVNNEYIDTLKIKNFEDTHTLRKFGDVYYDTTKETKDKSFSGIINSGSLENSNVNTVKEMVDMITVSRVYEANQKMITIHDAIMAKSANEIGRK